MALILIGTMVFLLPSVVGIMDITSEKISFYIILVLVVGEHV